MTLSTSAVAPTPGAGTVVNQVKLEYNGIDCLTADIQSHSGAVTGSTFKEQYQCTAAVDGILRRTSIIYPNGRTINYEYGDADSIDDVLNRVQSVHDDDLTVLAEYQYVGAAMPSVTTLPEPAIERRWKKFLGQPNGDAGDPYTGYDRFGRVEQMRWLKTGETPTDLVHVTWGYNRASLKTWRKDLLAPASANQDQHFSYDNLYQVTQRQQGLLNTNTTAVGGIPAQQENFNYDETGNWVQYQQRDAGELEIDQTRTNNKSNQITAIDGNGADVCYDKNGNMLKVATGGPVLDGAPRKLIWDAWNRLRKITDDEDNLLAEYQYDARTRRTLSEVDGVTRHYYYDDQWRSAEERLDSSEEAERQHLWHAADRWELILRDRSTENDEELDERLYSMKDHLDPVAVADAGGVVQERYAYTAFGLPAFLEADFSPITGNQSTYVWNWLFHAEFTDELTGWFNYGYRYYIPELGRWLSRDPIGSISDEIAEMRPEGPNLYAYVANSSINKNDIMGLCTAGQTKSESYWKFCTRAWVIRGGGRFGFDFPVPIGGWQKCDQPYVCKSCEWIAQGNPSCGACLSVQEHLGLGL